MYLNFYSVYDFFQVCDGSVEWGVCEEKKRGLISLPYLHGCARMVGWWLLHIYSVDLKEKQIFFIFYFLTFFLVSFFFLGNYLFCLGFAEVKMKQQSICVSIIHVEIT